MVCFSFHRNNKCKLVSPPPRSGSPETRVGRTHPARLPHSSRDPHGPIPAASSRTPDCSPRQAQIWDHKQTAPERPKSGSDGNSPIRFHPMGWRWHDDDGDSGRGLGGVPDLAGGGGDGAQCATRRVVQSRCHTEEVEPGRFVRKCEKTEQLLRDCVGRYSLCLVLSLNPLTWRLIGGAGIACAWF